MRHLHGTLDYLEKKLKIKDFRYNVKKGKFNDLPKRYMTEKLI